MSDHVAAFARSHPTLILGAAQAGRVIGAVLDVESINYHAVSARAKSVGSFKRKAAKCVEDGSPKYTDPLREIEDQVAVRVITYTPDAVGRVCDVIAREFEVAGEIDKGDLVKQQGTFGYASRHFVVRLKADRSHLAENQCLRDHSFEIQVRTVVQHAWAEFEHDVRYKGEEGDVPQALRAQMDRSFLLAAALLEMADKEFTVIDTLVAEAEKSAPHPRAPVDGSDHESIDEPPVSQEPSRPRARATTPLVAGDLPSLLGKRYADAPRSKKDHYEWMTQVLAACGITTVERLEETLATIDPLHVAAAMNHMLPAGQVRRLDDDLLAALGPRFAEASMDGALESSRLSIVDKRLSKLDRAGLMAPRAR